ncbi:MAG: TonB-dependent receptor [Gammaproteobacteria bacterium]|nr:TonB-dependent receptor [Gammaproteobacteria bacterium]
MRSETRSRRAILAAALLCLLIPSASLLAQAPPRSPWVFSVDGGGLHQTEVDLKDTEGAFSVDRWFVSAGVDYGFDPRRSIGISIGGGQSGYDFDDSTVFGAGDPWGDVKDFRVALPTRFGFGEKGNAFIIPSVRYNREDGASSSDGRTWGLLAAVAWRLNEDLTIGPGIGVFSRLEGGTRVFPILAIDWNITERWTLATGRGLGASQGPGLNLSYRVSDNWSLGLAGRYEKVEFRLDDKGVAPGGIGRDQSIPLVFTACLDSSPKLGFAVFAGIEFGGKLTLKNALDETVEETDYDPAPVIGASFEFRY